MDALWRPPEDSQSVRGWCVPRGAQEDMAGYPVHKFEDRLQAADVRISGVD